VLHGQSSFLYLLLLILYTLSSLCHLCTLFTTAYPLYPAPFLTPIFYSLFSTSYFLSHILHDIYSLSLYSLSVPNCIGILNKFSFFSWKLMLYLTKTCKKHVTESTVHRMTTFSHFSGSIWIRRRKNDTCFEIIQESTHFLAFS